MRPDPERESIRVRRYATVRGSKPISPGPGILRYLADPRGTVRVVDTRRLSATVCDTLHGRICRPMSHLSRSGRVSRSTGSGLGTGSSGRNAIRSGTPPVCKLLDMVRSAGLFRSRCNPARHAGRLPGVLCCRRTVAFPPAGCLVEGLCRVGPEVRRHRRTGDRRLWGVCGAPAGVPGVKPSGKFAGKCRPSPWEIWGVVTAGGERSGAGAG